MTRLGGAAVGFASDRNNQHENGQNKFQSHVKLHHSNVAHIQRTPANAETARLEHVGCGTTRLSCTDYSPPTLSSSSVETFEITASGGVESVAFRRRHSSGNRRPGRRPHCHGWLRRRRRHRGSHRRLRARRIQQIDTRFQRSAACSDRSAPPPATSALGHVEHVPLEKQSGRVELLSDAMIALPVISCLRSIASWKSGFRSIAPFRNQIALPLSG